MFTGIIQEIGKIANISNESNEIFLHIKVSKKIYKNISIGDSLAVNGICLTLLKKRKNILLFNAMDETIKKTNIKYWQNNDEVNLELAVKFNSYLGGHLVTGHVDGIGTIIDIKNIQNSILIKIKTNDNIINNIINKGSIALNGISLTIVEKKENWFNVSIIKHTLENTNISKWKLGTIINIENDYFVKIIKSTIKKI